jgi:fatty-acyl-CoA synthase
MAGPGRPGSVGLRLPYTQLEIRPVPSNRQEQFRPGEIGQITVRGPHVAPGYRDPQSDSDTFVGGELHTGDLGFIGEQGYLHVAGRVKDLIIRSGHNIDPLMIEDAMTAHPAVAVAAAIGMPDAYAGEVPICYVVLRPGAQASVEELRRHAESTINERPAWPKLVVVVDAVPMTGVGKIFKPELRVDATHRVVAAVLTDLQVEGARVAVASGGRQGIRVDVTLPRAVGDRVDAVRVALQGYLFESRVATE